ncbi:MAG: hypothetical protein NWE89_03640 [Candidatus Bathyarchaeota archaeon]|nr:hypothetical protein [Candidatus Bathyarchaeota archaeon]
MKKNLNILQSTSTGSRQVSIGSPEDMNTVIEVRRNSEGMKDVISRYKVKLEKYSTRIDKLSEEKRKLEKQLFP